MFVALAFVGKLPKYIEENIHQIRCYYDGDIYLIINDINSPYINNILKYNIKIINYKDVYNETFLTNVNNNINKFVIVRGLIGREELFIRSFERFFLLYNFMKNNNLTDCLFLELDNLIYDDPINWIHQFSKSELCYMFDNYNRYSSGIMYVKNYQALDGFLNEINNFININTGFMTEMTVLSIYYEKNKSKVQILPTYWNDNSVPFETYLNYDYYNDSLFDALAIGCNLLGLDPIHTDGIIKKNQKASWCAIDYTKLKFKWKYDDKNRKKPYVWNGSKWLLINNLHVHGKNLVEGISLPL